ncbi:MAG: hypothetical protein ACREPI_13235, partial [Candidatus Dormibacterales bacterium]
MFGTRAPLAGTGLAYHRLAKLEEDGVGAPGRLPVTIRVLLEGLVRRAEEGAVEAESVAALARWPAPPP